METEIDQLINKIRHLDVEEARNLVWSAVELTPGNARLWRVYASCFEETSDQAIRAFKRALELDPKSLDDHPLGVVLNRLSGRLLARSSAGQDSTCQYCAHYSCGHLGRQQNWFRCAVNHRLFEGDSEHDQELSDRIGEPMFNRPDCPDWQFRGSRFYAPYDPWWS